MRKTTRSPVRRDLDRRGFATYAAATLSCAVLASALLFHAWVRTRVTEEGYHLSRLSLEHRELTREHESLQIRAAELRSPQRIEELARSRLSMGPPSMDRMVVLVGGTVRGSLVASAR